MHDLERIKKTLVKEIYLNNVTTPFKKNLFELFQNNTKKIVKRAINDLLNEGIINAAGAHPLKVSTPSLNNDFLSDRASKRRRDAYRIRTEKTNYRRHDFFYKEFCGFLTDRGILEYENFDFKDPSKFSIEFIHLLHFLDETEEKNLKEKDIINGVISKGSTRTLAFLKFSFMSNGRTYKGLIYSYSGEQLIPNTFYIKEGNQVYIKQNPYITSTRKYFAIKASETPNGKKYDRWFDSERKLILTLESLFDLDNIENIEEFKLVSDPKKFCRSCERCLFILKDYKSLRNLEIGTTTAQIPFND